jgi:hypothetical protein
LERLRAGKLQAGFHVRGLRFQDVAQNVAERNVLVLGVLVLEIHGYDPSFDA